MTNVKYVVLFACLLFLSSLVFSAPLGLTQNWTYENSFGLNTAMSDMIVDKATGDIYVSGYTDPLEDFSYNFYVAKFDFEGNKIWEYTTPGLAFGLALDSTGNLYAAGASSGGRGYDISVLIKFDAATGAVLWSDISPGPGGDHYYTNVRLDSAENPLVLLIDGAGSNSVIKYSATTGTIITTGTYACGLGNNVAKDLVIDSADNMYALLDCTPNSTLVKFNSAGVQQ